MKTFSVAVLFFSALATACGDNAYRCVNPDGSVQDDFLKTNECALKLGLTQGICWCYHRAEDYFEVPDDKIDAFTNCCGATEGYTAREC